MGVGEDSSLEEGIAVTIIATGFNVEQQNEIVNTETKKIIHTLEDEQRAEQTLVPKKTASKYVPPVQKEEPKQEDKVVFNLEEEPEIDFPVSEKEEDVKDELSAEEKDFLVAREMKVIYEEVKAPVISEDDFVIIETKKEIENIEVHDATEIKSEAFEQQAMFTFDLPINNEKNSEEITEVKDAQENKIVHSLSDDNEITSQKKDEFDKVEEDGMKKYSLDDYLDFENKVNDAKPLQKKAEETEKLEIETKVVDKTAEKTKVEMDENVDPFDNPISEILVKRAAERRAKMKEFNYKFRSNISRIEEIEKQPAYKRAGIDLNGSKPGEEKFSRTTLGTGENDELQLRSNNSFLHDNVD